jgi:hypothetical protein
VQSGQNDLYFGMEGVSIYYTNDASITILQVGKMAEDVDLN